jgi:hypothetical protein
MLIDIVLDALKGISIEIIPIDTIYIREWLYWQDAIQQGLDGFHFNPPSSRRNSSYCIQVCRQQGYYGGPPDKMKQKSRA